MSSSGNRLGKLMVSSLVAIALLLAGTLAFLALSVRFPLLELLFRTQSAPQAARADETRLVTVPAGVWDGRRETIDRMTVHHTATDAHTTPGRAVDVGLIAEGHRRRGLSGPYTGAQGCAYHYLVLPDGEIQAGRPLNVQSSGTSNVLDNKLTIAVCLVGDFSPKHNAGRFEPAEPTARQLASLKSIALWAFDEYGFGPDAVKGHREVATSDCPGDAFDLKALRASLSKAVEAKESGKKPPLVMVR